MRRSIYFNFIVLVMLCFVSGCFPGSRIYRPISTEEKKAFETANRNVYPRDVKSSLATYSTTMLAWPGILLEKTYVEHEKTFEIQYILEFHEYDWIEDFGIQKERIFLSPKSEGIFKTSWFIRKDINIEEAKKSTNPGDLFIVYGMPVKINEDGSISVKALEIRVVNKQWYRFDERFYPLYR